MNRDLTPARGRWLYALLARLEKPLHRETSASIRQLYRRCCALRYALSQTSSAISVDQAATTSCSLDEFQAQLGRLNMLISIAGSYFGQGEEYDAFNRVLMCEGAEQSDEEDCDDDYEDDDVDEEAEYDENVAKDDSNIEQSTDRGGEGGGEWVAISVAGAVQSNRSGASSMELEDGEEPEEGQVDDEVATAKRFKS